MKTQTHPYSMNREFQYPFHPPDELLIEPNTVNLRDLSAFQRVYLERSYAAAGHAILTNRKSICRTIHHLEATFDCQLFKTGGLGELVPTPFADRLFNDLRFLHAAKCRLQDHIHAIHTTGRVLHISSSPAVFRTPVFRHLFRAVQSQQGIRTTYSAIQAEDAAKALSSGHCDLYIGCWTGQEKRFITKDVGNVSYRLLTRTGPEAESTPTRNTDTGYIVSLDGYDPTPDILPRDFTWQPLAEKQWLRWLDHPEECQLGTVVCGPDLQVDATCWTPSDTGTRHTIQQPLHASFLRQHPYEFLPSLTHRIQNRTEQP